jgi:hypothetical protein
MLWRMLEIVMLPNFVDFESLYSVLFVNLRIYLISFTFL